MRADDTLATLGALAGPATIVLGSVLSRVPNWLGDAFHSTAAVFLKSRPQEPNEPNALPTGPRNEKPLSPDRLSPRDLVDQLLAQHRYALLLRQQLVGNLSPEQLSSTQAALAEGMCLVPKGKVSLRLGIDSLLNLNDRGAPHAVELVVDSFYLDRYPVTNAQYYQFLAGGGYEQMAIWHKEIWPAVLDFVDQTGHPGPRSWHKGRYLRGEENLPVVGVSWYEAAAYARWVGKRLPTDAEWVKAASWPVAVPGQPTVQRRYPWGDTMDRTRANLWGSGPGRIVAVDQFAGGVSIGGVQQLIGNVWEWTSEPYTFGGDDADSDQPVGDLKSIRGGAYDTYLDQQATCLYQSGESALARKHNLGIRCAISLCDVERREGGKEPAAVEATSENHQPAEACR